MSRDSIRIAVHNGTYHTDDVFAMAIAVLWAHGRNYDCVMVRTRNPDDLAGCQVVLDVGDQYDPTRHRLDHHQPEFAEKRPNGIGYASAGLAWKHYGPELCGDDMVAWQIVDDTLIAGIDAVDVGVDLVQTIHPSGVINPMLSQLIGLSQPTWREEQADPSRAMNDAFWRIYAQAKQIILRAITHARDYVAAQQRVIEAYTTASDKRIVVMDYEYSAWIDTLSRYPEPLYFVYKRSDGAWGAKGVHVHGRKSFEIRKPFPASWAGKKNEELQTFTGVPDALFAHRNRFLVGATSQEGLIALVMKSIEAESE